jgi:hypothetical protein
MRSPRNSDRSPTADHPYSDSLFLGAAGGRFAFWGVATPADLIVSKHSSAFNIGRAVEMSGFQLQEAEPLVQGLVGKVPELRADAGGVGLDGRTAVFDAVTSNCGDDC